MSPEQLLGELEGYREAVVFDMEAGVGTLLRMEKGDVDVVLVVANPSAKSIEVARRAVDIAAPLARVVVVANRVSESSDVEAVRAAIPGLDLAVVPDDPAIARADRDGRAPIDVDPDAPAVRALRELGERLAAMVAEA